MILDLLSTCYSDYISVSRPPTLASSSIVDLSGEEEEEREPSPVHLSSALSTSSRASCFSRRLYPTDNKFIENNTNMSIIGRGKGIETNNHHQNDLSFNQVQNNGTKNSTSPVPSVVETSKILFS